MVVVGNALEKDILLINHWLLINIYLNIKINILNQLSI
jgi:hypothetical protein